MRLGCKKPAYLQSTEDSLPVRRDCVEFPPPRQIRGPPVPVPPRQLVRPAPSQFVFDPRLCERLYAALAGLRRVRDELLTCSRIRPHEAAFRLPCRPAFRLQGKYGGGGRRVRGERGGVVCDRHFEFPASSKTWPHQAAFCVSCRPAFRLQGKFGGGQGVGVGGRGPMLCEVGRRWEREECLEVATVRHSFFRGKVRPLLLVRQVTVELIIGGSIDPSLSESSVSQKMRLNEIVSNP